jgi:tRNA dimethylallyltransferase
MERLFENLSLNERVSRTVPVIYILGPTAIGKTKVSLSLASLLNGEIINSDAFSLYKKANIITAKASKEDQNSINHHIIDILELFDKDFTILEYTKKADECIKQLLDKNVTPIIVGGTNYYVNSILFEKIEENTGLQSQYNDILMNHLENEYFRNILHYDNDRSLIVKYLDLLDDNILYSLLEIVDKKYHNFLHKSDVRRIKNGLIYFFLEKQQKSLKLEKEKIKLKHHNTIVVYLHPGDKDLLKQRIETRIDQMLKEGGLAEIIEIFDLFLEQEEEIKFDAGLLQAIGYKEFYSFYLLLKSNYYNNVENIIELIENNLELNQEFLSCRTKLIHNTILYANSQLKYIKKRILPYIQDNLIQIDIEEFTPEKFSYYAENIHSLIKSHEFIAVDNTEKINKISNWQKYSCEICSKIFNGENEYNAHIRSNSHKKRRSKINKNYKSQNLNNLVN